MQKRSDRIRVCGIAGGVVALMMLICPPAQIRAADARDPALATVAGDTIRTSDLDSLLIATHRGMSGEQKASFDFENLLDKLINDRLILRDAYAIGMHEEPEIVEPVREATRKVAIGRYVRERFAAPDTVEESEVRDYFERYYWKIEMRQITVREESTADSLIGAIRAGASMDSLARERSLDPLSARGGLHNFKYWADVENPLREAARDLETGAISRPFAYRGAVAFIRVERRGPVDEDAYGRFAPSIREYLLARARDDAYRRFLQELQDRGGVRARRDALEAIIADSAQVLSGEFLDAAGDRVAVEATGGFSVSEAELRREVSHMKMENALLPFDSLLQRSLDRRLEDLVLTREVATSGYLEHPEIRADHRRRLDEAVINAYLNEFIASRISFEREEFREYYEEHKEEHRGPEEIHVDVLIVEEEPLADEIAARLQAGADFGFLKKEQMGSDPASASQPRWVTPELFAEPIAEALESLPAGDTTRAFDMGGRWGIFKVLGRRPGRIPTIEEMDMEIRRALFQRKFNALLDEHLATLEEAAGVERFEENIDRYFEGEGTEG